MKEKDAVKLERKIAIGMITSTKYIKQAQELIDTKWMLSREAKIIVSWCLEFFLEFKKAPKHHIEDIYFEKLSKGVLQKKQAELIENILESLSDEDLRYRNTNIEYLLHVTKTYCKSTKLRLYAEKIQDELDLGNVLEAEQLLVTYRPPEIFKGTAVIPLETHQQHRDAFESFSSPVIHYPGAVGDLLNQAMIKEGFVTFLGQNKGGKSFLLQDANIRAAKQGNKVVMFQAGDMSQSQSERRQAIYFAKKSDLKKYCKKMFIPILDCIHNQMGTCDLPILEDSDQPPVFPSQTQKLIKEMTYQDLKETFEENRGHIVCYNCQRSNNRKYSSFKGSIWFRERPEQKPLTWKEAYHLNKKKNMPLLKRTRLITYPSETLTMLKINAELDILAKQNFIPDVILIDYLDICAPDLDTMHLSIREQENKKWQRARRLSQERKCLLISASQSDAQGFDKKVLDKRNFSEDRRKLDHVTAMFGLNMTFEEKKKGLLRINDIVSREGDGNGLVNVFLKLQIGRPILGSFY